jgi:hypothetical protein
MKNLPANSGNILLHASPPRIITLFGLKLPFPLPLSRSKKPGALQV